ncbi:electroneutral sodium bicarbonate exchanger 1-like [Indicator indicator]|uniref:electroneutral sodium bicarbonate exchanger 1-like n=1 Tax=Indicator indicator TaxID=1002788 RepID=UPI0023DF2CD8|nr:electroneutral sodium bicarbonate exchanger 1-like [Indicator indicator]
MDENGGDQMASLKDLLEYDEEAVIDQGKWSSTASIHYEDELETRGEGAAAEKPIPQLWQAGQSTPVRGSQEDEQHAPHKLFCQLAEICVAEGEAAEWKDAARWFRFEEDVEDGGERWSKPYVATLSLPSLLQLRSFISSGTVLLDIGASGMEEIAVAALSPRPSADAAGAEGGGKQESSTRALSKAELRLLKRIPSGAEACSLLVGELGALQQPLLAFVRLAQAVLLPGLTEVPIPTRFLFVLLGPAGRAQQYHEVGRAMATLMMDEVFQAVAYKGKKPGDLVAGLEEFLERVKVLPAGQWDPSIRIKPPEKVPPQEKRKVPGAVDGSAAHHHQKQSENCSGTSEAAGRPQAFEGEESEHSFRPWPRPGPGQVRREAAGSGRCPAQLLRSVCAAAKAAPSGPARHGGYGQGGLRAPRSLRGAGHGHGPGRSVGRGPVAEVTAREGSVPRAACAVLGTGTALAGRLGAAPHGTAVTAREGSVPRGACAVLGTAVG